MPSRIHLVLVDAWIPRICLTNYRNYLASLLDGLKFSSNYNSLNSEID